jgi:protein gp37
MSHRLKTMGITKYANDFKVAIHNYVIDEPLTWKSPRLVFVNSMSDLFHEDIPNEVIIKIFSTMNFANRHTYQVLTKRSNRLRQINPYVQWTNNIWMGVSVENSNYFSRIDDLRQTYAKVKFLSLEPLLGRLKGLKVDGIDWVIVGGESGPNARPMEKEWVIEIRDTCLNAKVPFFFKQWGGKIKKKNGRLLEGKTWDEMPFCWNNQ